MIHILEQLDGIGMYRTSVGKMRQVYYPEAANAVEILRSDPDLISYHHISKGQSAKAAMLTNTEFLFSLKGILVTLSTLMIARLCSLM